MDDLVQQLDILADTLYIKDTTELRGIRHVRIYARDIVAAADSKITFSSPNWDQQFSTPTPQTGRNGDNGENGVHGPQVNLYMDVMTGVLDVTSNAGDGHKGQDGGAGAPAAASGHTQPAKSGWACSSQTDYCTCDDIRGLNGIKGTRGGNGGNAGTPGNGGNAGNVHIRYRLLNGQIKLKSCRGSGAPAANNGVGGKGGAGGRGGAGRNCDPDYIDWIDRDKPSKLPRGPPGYKGTALHPREKRRTRVRNAFGECPGHRDSTFFCKDDGVGPSGSRGPSGDDGSPGSTPQTGGSDGSVGGPAVKSGALEAEDKQSYPVDLLEIMRRQAEDLLLSNSGDQKGREALEFIKSVTDEITTDENAQRINKYATRKLAFLGKDGFDIFGNNKLFAPRIKWEALEGTVEVIKDAAEKYENAFNDIISTVTDTENFKAMGSKISEVASLQVNAERRRLEQNQYIAESEKRLYVKGIKFEEQRMTSILESIGVTLGDAYVKGQFNGADLIAMLQGVVGFYKAIRDKSPSDFIDNALSVADSFRGKQCLKKLSDYRDSITKWLTFGENYQPYEDPSQLDFDQLDVTAIPEIMQANLEMNKVELRKELLCLMEVASLPTGPAALDAEIESFFVSGAARIDLIGKCMDLDNEMGGYLFDVPLLSDTENAIKEVGKSDETPLTTKLQQNFLDYLLSTYRALERSFMRNLYELHKAFVFRTLWEGNSPLTSFQRLASESALGTGRLNGAVELTNVLQNLKQLQDKAVKCFTNNIFATGIKRWSWSKKRNPALFEDLTNGYAKFTLRIDKSCNKCYNLRLLKLYVELTGDEDQPSSVPDKVHLQVRHLSASYFRAGDGTTKKYYQSIGSYRNVEFDRFSVTNKRKCQEAKAQGKISLFCLSKDDSRWHSMCDNQLTTRGRSNKDKLLGAEECKSPFGVYDLRIPVDENLSCDDNKITNTNCKDLDRSKFTRLRVWTEYFYWPDQYPEGPDDKTCKIPLSKRNVTVTFDDDQSLSAYPDEQQ
ncbi:hypothetical protein ABFA07_018466 [Porites harrisoni]